MELQSILKMVSDQNRLRIINLIKDDYLCVGEIQTLLGMQQSNTSRHLEKLKYNHLLSYYKDGQKTFYSLNKDVFKKYEFFESLLYVDLTRKKIFKKDIKNLIKYKDSLFTCDDLKAVNYIFNKLGL